MTSELTSELTSETEPVENQDDSVATTREWSTLVFLGFLGVISCLYAVILIYHIAKPPNTVVKDEGLLEQCRQICLRYGLVSTGNVRKDAEAYLHAAQTQRLTDGLSIILADATFKPIESQSLPLLGQTAPDFSLPDVSNSTVQLSQLAQDRPVVVVFYLGYGCSHCVAQLLALDNDLHYFRELDADIVAISSDSSEHTAERYQEYGRFNFPVLADADYAVSKNWGVYTPESDGKPEFMNHGTFIVDRNGKVIWGTQGKEPFLDNKTLLNVIAGSQGLLPLPQPTQAAQTSESTVISPAFALAHPSHPEETSQIAARPSR